MTDRRHIAISVAVDIIIQDLKMLLLLVSFFRELLMWLKTYTLVVFLREI